jgi:cysteine-rich repeat protein
MNHPLVLRHARFLEHTLLQRGVAGTLTLAAVLTYAAPLRAECDYSIATSRQMTAIAENTGPSSWSPDGKRLAFSRQGSGAAPQSDLWVVEVDEPLAPPLRLTTAGDAPATNFAWSQDGSYLLYDGGCGIQRVASDGSGSPESVLCGGGNPSLNLTTSRLFYAVGFSGIRSIVVDPSGAVQPGTEVIIATGLPGALVQPTPSPDSDTLMFVRIGTGPNLGSIAYRLDGVLDILAGNTSAVSSLLDPRVSVFRDVGKFLSGPQFSLSGELVYFNEGLLDSTTFLGNNYSGALFPGEDVGTDGKALDPTDENSNLVLDEPSAGEWNGVLDAGEDQGLDASPLDSFDNGSNQSNMISDNDGVTNEPSLGEGNGQLDTGLSVGNRLQSIVARLDGSQPAQILGNRGFQIGVSPDGTRLSFTRRTWEGPLGTAKAFLNWDLFIGSVETTCLVAAAGGGSVIDGSGTTLEIPAGAMAADTSITIETPPVDLVPTTPMPLALARIYGPSGTTFSPPATISFHYTDEQITGFDEASLLLNVYNSGTEMWENLPTNVDSVGNILTASVAHFSPVAVWGESSCGNGAPDPNEACDDGDAESGDGCDANCTVTACGNGIATSGEACDDGNLASGDCCSSTCQFEAEGDPCAADSNPCTVDRCDGAALCEHVETPIDPALCVVAPRTKFQITNSDTIGKDKLSWQMSGGDAFDQADLGTPNVAMSTAYTLCIYDTAAAIPSLEASIDIAPSTTLWASKAPGGFQYTDKAGTSEGVTKLQLKTGIDGKTKVKLMAAGPSLALPSPFGSTFFLQAPSVTAQLVNSAGQCWSTAFVEADTSRNDASSFKAQIR